MNQKILKIGIVVVFISLVAMRCNQVQTYKNKKPNIIFFLTDDQRWDTFGFKGNQNILTPNCDKLAREMRMVHILYEKSIDK